MEAGTNFNKAEKICFFGLGAQFRECYGQLVLAVGRPPDLLSDNDPEKWGKEFFGKKCVSPTELAGLLERTAAVITVRKYEDILMQLREMGIKNIFLACFDRGYDVVHSIKDLGDEQSPSDEAFSRNPVKDRWTLVTGASRGIGRQIALAMAGLGSNIIAHGRSTSHLQETSSACSSLGVRVQGIAAELGNPKELEDMLDNLEHDFPPVDIVFNNAGISLPCSDPWDISSETYLAHYTVNTIAPIRICYRLIPGMIRRGFGRLVNVSSTIQKRPGEVAYACSKAALSQFVHDLAPSLDGTGVAISLVCPGHVRSDMGGSEAPHPVENVIPGAILGALLNTAANGRWIISQDYAGLSVAEAISRAKFYYSQKD